VGNFFLLKEKSWLNGFSFRKILGLNLEIQESIWMRKKSRADNLGKTNFLRKNLRKTLLKRNGEKFRQKFCQLPHAEKVLKTISVA
jgi:hypothetical protein